MSKTFERQELAMALAVALHGSLTHQVLAAALKDCDPSVAYKVLANLEAAGALKRFRVVGCRGLSVWLTTQAYEKGQKAGVKNFTTLDNLCMPPKEWLHDQLAARFTLLCAGSPNRALLEHEIRRWDQAGLPRLPDGVFLNSYSHSHSQCKVVAIEVERSSKTGINGGWAKLAASMIDRLHGAGEEVPVWHARVEATMVIAPRFYMQAISANVRRTLARRRNKKHEGPIDPSILAGVWWWWIDLDKPNSSPLLMSALDDCTEESGFLGYDAWQEERTKDPARQERALRIHQARKVAKLRAKLLALVKERQSA